MHRPSLATRDPPCSTSCSAWPRPPASTPEVAAAPAAALRALGRRAAGAGRRRPRAPSWPSSRPARRAGVHVVAWGAGADEPVPRRAAVGAERVVELPGAAGLAWPSCSPTSARPGAREGVLVGVVGGSGGAGATTFACALGQVAAARGRRWSSTSTRSGPGSTGCSALDGRRRGPVGRAGRTTGRLSARSLREALPRRDGLGVLSWPPGSAGGAAGVRRPRGALGRPGAATTPVVVDLPRAADPLVDEVGGRAATGCWSSWSADRRRGRLGGAAAPRLRRPRPASGWWCAAPALDPRRGRAADRRARARRRWPTSAGWPSARPRARPGALAARPAGRAAATVLDGCVVRRHGGRGVTAGARGRARGRRGVRERLARTPGELTPAPRGRGAARGRPAGRRRHGARRPRAAAPRRASAPVRSSRCSACPASPTCWSTAPDQVYVDRGAGLERDRRAVRRRRGGPPARPAAGRRWAAGASTTPRRTSTSGCPTAPGSTRCWRRCRGPAPDLAAGAARRGLHPRRAGRRRHADRGRRRPAAARWSPRRLAFLVSGGTGTRQDHPARRAARPWSTRPSGWSLVEDASELRPDHPHVVGLEARPANVEGAGAVELRTLVRQALRMRPDRLVVGEVRGAEVVDLLAALNTGHEGGCGTLHANSAADVPARIEALALAAGLDRARRAQPAGFGGRRRGAPRPRPVRSP